MNKKHTKRLDLRTRTLQPLASSQLDQIVGGAQTVNPTEWINCVTLKCSR